MVEVELIYDHDCPAAPQARENLREALLRAGFPPKWVEWERSAPDTPDRVRIYGSPTILVNGRDVAGGETAQAACCRIYQLQPGQFAAVPSVELILKALREAETARDSANGQDSSPPSDTGTNPRLSLFVIPAMLVSLMPVLTCPLCWPGYAALLSSLGLGFVASARFLFPLTLALLGTALVGLALQTRRHGLLPVVLAAVASIVIILGKFVLDSSLATYTGVALLFGASVLSVIRNREALNQCFACAPNRGVTSSHAG